MKKMAGKYVIILGAVAIALLMVSSATAVPQVHSGPVMNYIENEEQEESLGIDSGELYDLNVLLTNFLQNFFGSDDFINFMNSDDFVDLASELMDMTPTLVNHFENSNNENTMEDTFVEVLNGLTSTVTTISNVCTSVEVLNGLTSTVTTISNVCTSGKPDTIMDGDETLISRSTVMSSSLGMEESTVAMSGGDTTILYYELKTLAESSQFETLKGMIENLIDAGGYFTGILDDDWGIEVFEFIAAVIGFACFILFLPIEIWGYNMITVPIVMTGTILIAFIPSILISIALIPILLPGVIIEDLICIVQEFLGGIDLDELKILIGPILYGVFILCILLTAFIIELITLPFAAGILAILLLIAILDYTLTYWLDFLESF